MYRKYRTIARPDQGHRYTLLEVPGLTCPGQGLNPGLPRGKQALYLLVYLGSTVKSGNVVTVGQCRHLHSNFLLQHSLLVCEDMKFLQKDVMLALILCIQFCDVGIGLIFTYFVIRDTPVLGDDFIFGNSQKANRNLQEGPNLLSSITLDIVIIIQN